MGRPRNCPFPLSSPSQTLLKVSLIHVVIWVSTVCSEYSTLRPEAQRKPRVPDQRESCPPYVHLLSQRVVLKGSTLAH